MVRHVGFIGWTCSTENEKKMWGMLYHVVFIGELAQRKTKWKVRNAILCYFHWRTCSTESKMEIWGEAYHIVFIGKMSITENRNKKWGVAYQDVFLLTKLAQLIPKPFTLASKISWLGIMPLLLIYISINLYIPLILPVFKITRLLGYFFIAFWKLWNNSRMMQRKQYFPWIESLKIIK